MNLQQSAKDRAEQLTADRLSVEKFAVGQSVPRKEDPMLLRGQGHYTDDIALPGQAYAVMVRSQNAHGVIRSIDTEAAKKMPGVLGVYTAADLKGYGPLKCIVRWMCERLLPGAKAAAGEEDSSSKNGPIGLAPGAGGPSL